MEDYASNSNASKKAAGKKQPDKKIEKVVEGEVERREQSFWSKAKHALFGSDFRTAASYVVTDVMLPAARDMVVNSVSRGIARAVYGDTSPRSMHPGATSGRQQYYTPVSRPSTGPTGRLPQQPPVLGTQQMDPGTFVFADKSDADRVLTRMFDILKQYEAVSLADLNELIGLPVTHVDHKWGWVYLEHSTVLQGPNGFVLSLPQVQALS